MSQKSSWKPKLNMISYEVSNSTCVCQRWDLIEKNPRERELREIGEIKHVQVEKEEDNG